MSRVRLFLLVVVISPAFACMSTSLAAVEAPLGEAAAAKLFAERVAPLLKAQCVKCHGDGDELGGELDLRTREAMLAGGESGDALVPGKPYLSLIYRAVRYDDEVRMPPKAKFNERLAEEEKEWVFRWIEAGAPWPADVKMAKVKPAAKIFVGVDPTNPGQRLPDYEIPPPDYQYRHGEIYVPAARADEPKLTVWSADRAAKYLEDGATAWTRERQCVACHTNGAYMLVRPALAPYLGPPSSEVKAVFTPRRREPQLPLDKRPAASTPIFDLLIACSLAEWDAHVTHRLSPETDQAMRLMCDAMSPAGNWKISPTFRWVPYIVSQYHDACSFAKAIGTAPGWLEKVQADGDKATLAAVARLRKFLQTAQPDNDFDRVYLLWADLRWPGLIDQKQRGEMLQMLATKQRPDGGWSLRSFGTPENWANGVRKEFLLKESFKDDPPSDGHMTGLALIVLRESGVPVDDPRIQRGVAWLKSNQRESGRWWTKSLNTDYWQFSTYHGTANALLALALCNEIPRLDK